MKNPHLLDAIGRSRRCTHKQLLAVRNMVTHRTKLGRFRRYISFTPTVSENLKLISRLRGIQRCLPPMPEKGTL